MTDTGRDSLHIVLAEIAAIAGRWGELADQARRDPSRRERIAQLTPRAMAGIMVRALGALEATGVDVARVLDLAGERTRGTLP